MRAAEQLAPRPVHRAAHARQSPAQWALNILASLRRNLRPLVLGAVLLAMLFAALYAASLAAYSWPGWSLRYGTPISGPQATAARGYAIDNPEDIPWPTFWAEATLPLQSDLGAAEAPCVLYSGQGTAVWPARFLAGGWPGATDEAGCVVSAALADALWGSREVVGKRLDIDGKAHWVRGIFEGANNLCIAQTSDTGAPKGWQGVELYTGGKLDRNAVMQFIQGSGLGTPDTLLPGEGLCAVARLLCWLPVAVLLLAWGLRWAARQNRTRPILTKVITFALVLGLALALPRLLGLLPDAVVPSRWSDFAYWGQLGRQLAAYGEALLAMRPALRDVQGKLALLAAGGLSLAGLPLALWLAAETGTRPRDDFS